MTKLKVFLFYICAVVKSEELPQKCAYSSERDEFSGGEFPSDFKWSLATAAYQIEGSYQAAGKGENIWDVFSNVKNDFGECNTHNCDTGNIACDSYKQTGRDIQLIKDMGVKDYRFSLSWTRILPEGTGEVNQAGIDHYSKFIDDLIAAGIEPFVTLYHWDLPNRLQEKYDGWLGPEIVDDFVNYADVCYKAFGDRVKFWITLNEPQVVANQGYGNGAMAPGIKGQEWTARHHTVLAHVKAYDLYKRVYKEAQGGQCGITMNSDWYEPKTDTPKDVKAAQDKMDLQLGFWADPIYTERKDYPEYIREIAGDELPPFTEDEKAIMGNAADFFGLNHYTARLLESCEEGEIDCQVSFREYVCPTWPTSGSVWLFSVPWGFRYLLKYVHKTYDSNKYTIYNTENGISSKDNGTDFDPELNDVWRTNHYKGVIGQMQRAITEDKVNIRAYTAWSLMDNYEWSMGYSERFGLNWVNFTDPERAVFRKDSGRFYEEVATSNKIEMSDNYNSSQFAFISFYFLFIFMI